MQSAAFYYQQIKPEIDLSAKLGDVDLVVTTNPRDPAGAISAIHGLGAKAFKYIQFYWAPAEGDFEGINLGNHPEWAFCRTGDEPLVGRVQGAESWFFLDANEEGLRSAVIDQLASIKAEGWDGVMFDRGWAATQTGADVNGEPVWSVSSTCTDEPANEGATFSDAYVAMVALAHPTGLEVLLNSGYSPFDPVVAMRPDPRHSACQAAQWNQCPTIDDVWAHVDYMLDEAPAHPGDAEWERDFEANRRNEQHEEHAGKVIGLLTSGTLGGDNRKDTVFFEWARVRLFDVPLAVNTGDDGCPNAAATAICNRHGNYPELASIRFGNPLSDSPTSVACEPGSAVRCLWTRHYERGVSVVNVGSDAQILELVIPSGACAKVRDVYEQSLLANGECVDRISVEIPAGAGRPFTYETGS